MAAAADRGHALGMDLGTSNCALAWAPAAGGPAESLEITQVLGPGRAGERRTFASALYYPAPGQFPPDSLRPPWLEREPEYVAGDFAREVGALSPERLVTSAKSWLSYRSLDPTRPILPWGAPGGGRISPLEASRRYLEHLLQAYRAECARRGAEAGPAQAVLTVPASFDEVARTLTARAAREAGLGEGLILLEEPQAAFYAWLDGAGPAWREQARPGDLVLVCDVGGGTTDFSLIAVTGGDGGDLGLERIGVGRHILLGGDNMDLALAHVLRQRWEDEGKAVDEWQFQALVHASRRAKEELFSRPDLDAAPIAVPARGSSLLAGTLSTALPRDLLEAVIVDGFFALTGPGDMPAEPKGAGLREMGLPYEADAVISKHLAAFLARALRNARASAPLAAKLGPERLAGDLLLPDAVLFNGGVFRPGRLRARVLQLLRSWAPGREPRALEGADPDLAVARGAALYGRTRLTGKGPRIRAGASRSYYIGLEPTVPAIPGYRPPVKALCVVPQGMEEGAEAVLEDKVFGLTTGAPVTFRFFGSAARAGDGVGAVVANAERDLEETARLETALEASGAGEGDGPVEMVPVKLHGRLTELGTLELWLQEAEGARRWELRFDVRTE